MSRSMSTDMLATLQQDGMSLAVVVRIERRDGIVLGFTTYDESIAYDDGSGLVSYEATNAVLGSSIRQDIGTSVDNLDVMGILSSDSITDEDLLAGRYDDAAISMAYVDPTNLPAGHVVLMSGLLGEARWSDGKFTIEFRSLGQLLSQNIGELTTPSCRVVALGDARCKFSLAGNVVGGSPARSIGTVTAVEGRQSFHMSGIVVTAGFYTYGRVAFLTGGNTGVDREVKSHGLGSAIVNFYSNSGLSNSRVPWSPSGCGLNFNFPIPAGVWQSGYVVIELAVTKLSHLPGPQGTDSVFINVPTVNQYSLGQASENGHIKPIVSELSGLSMAAVNAAAGGNLASCFQLGAFGATTQYTDVSVVSCELVLAGVSASTSNQLLMADAFPFDVHIGDTATVEVGCDRSVEACENKFNNVVNFRGEPYVPGMDQLLQRGRGG